MLVRHELGPEASVIQTREVGGAFFGWLGKPMVEVQASRDAKVVRRIADVPAGSVSAPHATATNATTGTAVVEKAPHAKTRATSFGDDRFDMTEEDIATPEDLLGAQANEAEPDSSEDAFAPTYTQPPSAARAAAAPAGRPAAPQVPAFEPPAGAPNYLTPAMFEVFTEMLDADVDPDAARLMLQEVALHCSPAQLNDPWLIKGRLCQIIQQRITVSGPIDVHSGQPQIVALVGPTGVGKTTTLAKLAAGFHFDQGIQVGMITLDTFRMGAVDQLQKYADLLGAACEVVQSPDQMVPAIYRLRHCPLILIDTAGRSPRDQSQLKVLGDFLQAAEPTQTHLVLSAASSPAHVELAMDQFRQLNPTHLLLTKLDEALCLGSWYGPLASRQWPLSYLTTGQRVPEDIVTANSRRVASLILGQVRT